MDNQQIQSEQPIIEEKAAGNAYTATDGWPFGKFDSKRIDYTGTPPFSDAEWAGLENDALPNPYRMCEWCAGTGHPHGNPEYGICECPDLVANDNNQPEQA